MSEAIITFFSMLIGEYLHTIDQKNRFSIPARFRKELGKRIVVTRGLDQCLFLYGVEEWNRLAEKLAQLPWGKAETRSFVRMMIAGAMDVDIDALGRILLPDYLKKYGKIEEEAMIVGLYNRVEIWCPELWRSYAEGAERQVGMIAEKLGESGMY